MNLIKHNLYRNLKTGQYLRLLATSGGFCTARSDNEQWTWRGPEALFRQEFSEVDISLHRQEVGPSEHK